MAVQRLPFVLMRGGTSKCVVVESSDLPADRMARDEILLRVFGSPDARQIDGIGGATASTSKAIIIEPDDGSSWDVAYTFAQVGIDQALVDYAGNCGNCVAAVGPYAIESGRVAARAPMTTVRIRNTNTDSTIVAEVPVEDGRPATRGEYTIPGVPGSGPPIKLWFDEPSGSVTGTLLPTGRVVDQLKLEAQSVSATILDAGNLVVFIEAAAVGATGRETAAEIDANSALLKRLEALRGAAAVLLGMAETTEDATTRSPGVPKVAFVGHRDPADQPMDTPPLYVRLLARGRAHQSFAITVGIATAAAARLPGSVVAQHRPGSADDTRVVIAHSAGTMAFDTEMDAVDGTPVLRRVAAYRTARRLAEGNLLLP
jgi:2-methylaconitate cis-trans-isomerase PrpF